MRAPRLRLRLWTLLVLIATVAVGLGVARMHRRWAYCREQAARYRQQVQIRLDDASRSQQQTDRTRERFRTDLSWLSPEARVRLIDSLDRRTQA